MLRHAPALLLLFLSACALSACERGVETREDLLGRMAARYDANRGAVGGFVVTGGGGEATHAALPDRTSALPPPAVVPAGDAADPARLGLLAQQVANVRLLSDTLRTATMSGPVDRRGARVYVLTSPPRDGRTLAVVVDAETFDVREIEQAVAVDTLARPLVTRLLYDDFRTEGGLTLPFRVRQLNEGLDQLVPADQRRTLGDQARRERSGAELLPPGASREARMADLDRQIRLFTEGIQETELRVKSVRVLPRGE